jgi:hypothetical protein
MNEIYIDSLTIAKQSLKRHNNIISAIEKINCTSKFREDNYEISFRYSIQNKPCKYYNITKEGYDLFNSRNIIKQKNKNSITYLYVLYLSTGVIKVGKSIYPERRIKQHSVEAAKYGCFIEKKHISGESKISENDLIRFCKEKGGNINTGKEYFINIDFEDVVSFLKENERNKKHRLVINKSQQELLEVS